MTPITALGSRYGIQGALGRSVKRTAAGGGWWDLNGTITSCIAAYQGTNVASKAASLVNLANSSSYNLTEAGTVTWDSDGWGFPTSSDGFATGLPDLTPSSTTIIARIDPNGTGPSGYQLVYCSGTNLTMYYDHTGKKQKIKWAGNTTYQDFTITRADHTFALAGYTAYYNGSSAGSLNTGFTSAMSSVNLGRQYTISDTTRLKAIAFYSAELTSTNIGNLTTAMAAL